MKTLNKRNHRLWSIYWLLCIMIFVLLIVLKNTIGEYNIYGDYLKMLFGAFAFKMIELSFAGE